MPSDNHPLESKRNPTPTALKSQHPLVEGPLDLTKFHSPFPLSERRLIGMMRQEFDVTELIIRNEDAQTVARFDFSAQAGKPAASEIALALEQAMKAGFDLGREHEKKALRDHLSK
jgi:hypothetical protein